MLNKNSDIVRELEKAYDIPFVISRKDKYDDPVFVIRPKEHEGELFSLTFTIKQNTRLIVEFIPDRYSAVMIANMNFSDDDQRAIFVSYLNLLINGKGATVDLRINNSDIKVNSEIAWPEKWKSVECRITKSPITSEDVVTNPYEIVGTWAVVCFGMFLSLLNIVPIDDMNEEKINVLYDGEKTKVTSTRYERNPINRQLCIAARGCKCAICGFDFGVYGELGKGFIHIHHIEPVSSYYIPRAINPSTDLIPVCPNCHAMLHRVNPPIKPEELKRILENQSIAEVLDAREKQ